MTRTKNAMLHPVVIPISDVLISPELIDVSILVDCDERGGRYMRLNSLARASRRTGSPRMVPYPADFGSEDESASAERSIGCGASFGTPCAKFKIGGTSLSDEVDVLYWSAHA